MRTRRQRGLLRGDIMGTHYKIGDQVYRVAGEHGRRGTTCHLLTLVASPDDVPHVMTLRPKELELGGFVPEDDGRQDESSMAA